MQQVIEMHTKGRLRFTKWKKKSNIECAIYIRKVMTPALTLLAAPHLQKLFRRILCSLSMYSAVIANGIFNTT